MNIEELRAVYRQRAGEFTTLLNQKKTIINRISTARALTALAVLASTYLSFQTSSYLWLLLASIALFVALVRWHAVLFNEKEHLENLASLNHGEIAALQGDYSAQPTGIEFADAHHPYSSDLDLFGEASMFQYLNRTCTAAGKEMLAERLLHPLSTHKEIITHQQAIKELKPLLDFRQNLQATAMQVKDSQADRAQLRAWVQHPFLFLDKRSIRLLLSLSPLITVAVLVLAISISEAKYLAIGMVLLQWTVTGLYLKRISAFHDYVSRKKHVLEHYARLLSTINGQSFQSELLRSIQSSTQQAEEKLMRLASLMSALDARLNFMTSLVLNALVLYDMQCVLRLERWKEKNALHLETWLDAIGSAEVLNSFATYAFNNPSYGYASITDKEEIHAVDIGHPLLGEKERVANTVQVGSPHKIVIITGANMAGKSTFLRTLGVNLLLALNGAPVCAREFACPIIRLRTGMRTTDSLKDHQSYFYAELHRLKEIISELNEGKKMLVLLDEILKGTNSNDKLTGSVALVKQLLRHPCLVVIATHDLALGALENELPDRVINYHFEPTIETDVLSFDYRLKRGIAEKMNATFLMRKMGIV